ncbi:unnamed protein product [Lota lota]
MLLLGNKTIGKWETGEGFEYFYPDDDVNVLESEDGPASRNQTRSPGVLNAVLTAMGGIVPEVTGRQYWVIRVTTPGAKRARSSGATHDGNKI